MLKLMTALRAHSTVLAAAVAIMAVLSGGGCAQRPNEANWQNPNVPKEEWSLDMGNCRREARREVQRQVGAPAAGARTDNIGGGLSAYEGQMTDYQMERLGERTFAACMRRLGYTPISKP